jgi:iron complex transport system substrate-binding protein
LIRRVVSLTCSNTEIVCALGCADRLVGVDDHSDFPPAVVRALPRVGPDLGIDVARVAALDPDLVLASLTVPGHERIVAALAGAGLPHLAPEPVSIEDVYSDIRLIGSKLGVPARAEALIAGMRAELDAAPGEEPRPRVLVEWWPKPVICPGRDSWVNQLLAAAGGANPLADRAVKSQPLSDDEVCALAPDAVVISWCGVRPEKYRPDVVYRRARWRELPALRERRVYCVPEAYLGRPGPRLVEGFRALRAVVLACRAGALTRADGPPAPRS